MRNILILLLILLLLGGLYMFSVRSEDKVRYEDREFAAETMDQIYVVTLKKPGHPQIHLSRQKSGWLLNQRRKASSHVVNNLLSVLTKLEIDYIPPKPQYNKVMKDIATHGIQTVVYDKSGNILAEYTVGKNTTSEGGTFFLNKGANQPYVMRVPSVSGGIRIYYSMNTVDFRDKSILDINNKQVSKITLDYKRDRKNSFVIDRRKDSISISPLVNAANFQIKQNANVLSAYLQEYKRVGAEFIRTGDPSMDSLRHVMPFAELKVDMQNGESYGYSFYPDEQVYDKTKLFRNAQDLEKTDRHFVLASDGEVYILQQRLLKGIFKTISYFDR